MTRPTQRDYLRLRNRSDAALANVVRTYATTDKGAAFFGKRAAAVLVQQHAQAVAMGRALATGGSSRVTPEDRIKARSVVLGKDGEASFLAGFVRALKEGKYTDEDGNPKVKSIQSRAALYSRKLAATATREFVEASGDGFTYIWKLTPGENCIDCLALAAGSPYKPGQLHTVPLASDTICHSRCRCFLIRSDGVRGFSGD